MEARLSTKFQCSSVYSPPIQLAFHKCNTTDKVTFASSYRVVLQAKEMTTKINVSTNTLRRSNIYPQIFLDESNTTYATAQSTTCLVSDEKFTPTAMRSFFESA